MSPLRLLIIAVVAALALGACGGDDDAALDCDLGNEITADFDAIDASDEAPTVESLESVRDKIADFDAPDEIADDVDQVVESLDVFIEELGSDQPDLDAIQTAGQASSDAGDRIEAYLEENC